MTLALRPYVTAGIAIVGASLIAVSPVAPPPTNVQQRALKLVDYTEYDASQLASATEANWSGLETILSSSNWTTDPDISQGLSTLLTDLGTGASNPVTDPFSLLIEGALGLLTSTDAANAASTALTAVTDNVESAFSSGDYSTALTDLENGGTTVLYAFLNGYPDAVGTGNDLSPEFGLLTNTLGGLATGQLDGLQQLSNTIADEISAIGGGGLTTSPTILEPGSLDLSVNLDSLLNILAPGGDLNLPFSIDGLLGDLGGSSGDLTLPVSLDGLLGALGGSSGDITLPVSLNDLLAGATPGGDLTLPLSLNDLLTEFAGGPTSDLTVPITPDDLLGDVLGSGGNLSVSLPEETILSAIAPSGNISIPISVGPIHENVSVSLSTIESALGLNSSSAINFNIPDSTVLSTIESALGASGNDNISIPVSSLENLLGTTGSDPITVSTATLEGLLGTSGSDPISLSVSDLETLLGTSGSEPISVPISTLESLLGTFGSDQISLPISTLEGLLPSTLTLDLDIPGITGGAVPNYDIDLAQDLLAALGNITPIASDLPALLGPDPTFDVTSLLSGLVGDLGLPVSITGGDLTLNLTGLVSEVLAGL
ncbi:MAG: hypothetical protein QOH07_167 [Mycobacterium sp.]|jgi:hypothetical protein|nr:hypothetical protein [Mycobacterium sp.]